MRQRRVSLDVLDFSLLIIDQYPNNNKFVLYYIHLQFMYPIRLSFVVSLCLRFSVCRYRKLTCCSRYGVDNDNPDSETNISTTLLSANVKLDVIAPARLLGSV